MHVSDFSHYCDFDVNNLEEIFLVHISRDFCPCFWSCSFRAHGEAEHHGALFSRVSVGTRKLKASLGRHRPLCFPRALVSMGRAGADHLHRDGSRGLRAVGELYHDIWDFCL